jgi:NAD dependent epimerase/dehydratase family enzyme
MVARGATTNRDFTKLLAAETHRMAFVRVPAFALKIVFGAQLTHEAILASQRVRPKVLTQAGFSFSDPTLESILRYALED